MSNCENGRVGQIFGHEVQIINGNYVFGCGAVKFPIGVVNNFLAEAEVRLKAPKTKQQKDFQTVMSELEDRSLNDNGSLRKAIAFFAKVEQRVQGKKPTKKPAKKKK